MNQKLQLQKGVSSRIKTDFRILKSLRSKNGLFIAAHSDSYRWAWIRDNIWEAMGLEAVGDKSFLKTYHALLDIFRKHEEHLDNNFVFAK